MTNVNGDTLYEMRYLGRSFIGNRKASGQFIDGWLREKQTENGCEEHEQGRPLRLISRTVHRGQDTWSLSPVQTIAATTAGQNSSYETCGELDSCQRRHADDSDSQSIEKGDAFDEILANLPCGTDSGDTDSLAAFRRRATLINVSDMNRIMLLQTSNDRLSFISLDRKSIILEKLFSEICYCTQGEEQSDHFGFICRDGQTLKFVMYIFQCSNVEAVNQILHTLWTAFTSSASDGSKEPATLVTTPQKQKEEATTCDLCPTVQLQKLISKLDSVTEAEARYNVIHECIRRLSSTDYKELMNKVKSEQCRNVLEKNDVLMTKLRIMCQLRQLDHSCSTVSHSDKPNGAYQFDLTSPPPSNGRSPSVLGALKDRAKKALSERFMKKSMASPISRDVLHLPTGSFHDEKDEEAGGRTAAKPIPLAPGRSPLLSSRRPDELLVPQGHRRRSATLGAFEQLTSLKNLGITELSSSEGRNQVSTKDNTFASTHSDHNQATIGTGSIESRAVLNGPPSLDPAMEDVEQRRANPKATERHHSPDELQALWKMSTEQALLLNRLEKENQTIEECEQKRQQLAYEEVTVCTKEAANVWTTLLLHAAAGSSSSVKLDRTTLRSAVINGIPHTRREEVWPLLAQQYVLEYNTSAEEAARLLAPSSPYQSILEEFTPERHAILIDLGRTFPKHPYFQSQLGTGQLALFNILKAYSLLDKEVGYCQGLCFVAGILLLHVKEAEAFQMLKHIMLVLDMRQQYKPKMDAMQVKTYQLSRLLQRHERELHEHFELHGISPSLYATPWFMTLFSSEFPIGFVVRVFDFVLLDGPEFIFAICLALFAVHKELLLQKHSLEEINAILKSNVPSMNFQQMDNIFNKAVVLDISEELDAYQAEYIEILDDKTTPSSSDDDDSEGCADGCKRKGDVDPVAVVRRLRSRVATLRDKLKHQRSRGRDQTAIIDTLQRSHADLAECVRRAEIDQRTLRNVITQLSGFVSPAIWQCAEAQLIAAGVKPPLQSPILDISPQTQYRAQKNKHDARDEDNNECAALNRQMNAALESET